MPLRWVWQCQPRHESWIAALVKQKCRAWSSQATRLMGGREVLFWQHQRAINQLFFAFPFPQTNRWANGVRSRVVKCQDFDLCSCHSVVYNWSYVISFKTTRGKQITFLSIKKTRKNSCTGQHEPVCAWSRLSPGICSHQHHRFVLTLWGFMRGMGKAAFTWVSPPLILS